jgi:NAD(P)H dehydrogenase (quinone)
MGSAIAALAITGATGQLGGRIARRLAATGVAQRLLVREPDRAPRLPAATSVRAPYGGRAAVRSAPAGLP